MQNMDCSHCRRTFYKLEHLKRHERIHTGSKPHVCGICHRAFGRQDSLARHERLHSRDGLGHNTSHSPSASVQSTSSSATPGPADRVAQIALFQPDSSGHPQFAGLHSPPLSEEADQLVPGASLNINLIWPDSESLFQNIIRPSSVDQWQSTLENLSSPSTAGLTSSHFRFGEQPSSIDGIPVNGSNQVVHSVSNTIHLQSSSITAAENFSSMSSIFLDECLHTFFARFIPTFPILHRPTFIFRESLQPLLLNAIAIGSLYVGHGNAARKQGEVLWRLAHTALATMWQDMISHQASYDPGPGIQLLITSALSQVYGALSENAAIRMTSQTFQALAFVWAEQCGIAMNTSTEWEPLPSLNDTEETKNQFWRKAVAKDVGRRALLAHYALDGLVTRMTGSQTSGRQMPKKIAWPMPDNVFAAETADDFILMLQVTEQPSNATMRSTFRQLMSPMDLVALSDQTSSAFCLTVLLEQIQSNVLGFDDDTEEQPDQRSMTQSIEANCALKRLRRMIVESVHLSTVERQEALLRWHAVSLEHIVSTANLSYQLCQAHDIQHNLSPQRRRRMPLGVADLSNWPRTSDARRALLHAIAIQELIEDLPRGRAHAIHMPSALFAAATICATFCLGGVTNVNLPKLVAWDDVVSLAERDDAAAIIRQPSQSLTDTASSGTRRFIRGEFDPSTFAFGAYRNLPYEFNSIMKLFRCLATQWGVAAPMECIILQWKDRFQKSLSSTRT